MIPCSEVNDCKLLGFQTAHFIDHLLYVGDRPTFKWTSGRIQSNKVESKAPLLRLVILLSRQASVERQLAS